MFGVYKITYMRLKISGFDLFSIVFINNKIQNQIMYVLTVYYEVYII